ncbi:MAG TPA: WYL domain-containing protein [Acidimicrobiales bacterium]|nr:WYL domain-containing protein [Acidimicrobiales bacterium]
MTLPESSSPVSDAGARLVRLLAVLSYLARVEQATIADLAERFDMDERALVAELELAACCGLPPYTPDSLLELVVDDEGVSARGLEALRSPPRLTPDEGFALAASLRAMLAVPGAATDGPLLTALEKLEVALGVGKISVELEAPDHLDELREAAASGESIEIDYLGAKRGDESTRRVDPYAVVAREGRFYLDAYCMLAGDWRRFQVARIRAVRRLGQPVAPRHLPAVFSSARAFVGGEASTVAHVALDEARYVLIDRFASGPTSTSADGRVVVPIEVADEHFLGRLMLRLGPGAEVLDPPGLADAAARVAARALSRYDDEPTK